MQLKPYLKSKEVSLRDFAVRIGVANAGVVSKYINGKQVPRPPIMARIVAETEGVVQPNDFYAAASEAQA